MNSIGVEEEYMSCSGQRDSSSSGFLTVRECHEASSVVEHRIFVNSAYQTQFFADATLSENYETSTW